MQQTRSSCSACPRSASHVASPVSQRLTCAPAAVLGGVFAEETVVAGLVTGLLAVAPLAASGGVAYVVLRLFIG